MTEVIELPMRSVYANAQDRKTFDEAELDELARSIKTHGLVQPITVRPDGDGGYVIVAGERRFRAHERLKATTIQAVVRNDLDDAGHADVQLIENVNRADLDPFEEALAYQARMERFGIDEQGVADRYGKPVAVVKKRLELLLLDEEFRLRVRKGELPIGHAGVMAKLDSNRQRLAFKAFADAKGGLTFWQFQTLVDRLYADQQQDSMFDLDSFLKIDEYVADAKKSSKITGRTLVHLSADLGTLITPFVDVLIDAGIDGDRLRQLLDMAEQVRVTRIEQQPGAAKESTARGRKRAGGK